METKQKQRDYVGVLRESHRLKAPSKSTILNRLNKKMLPYGISVNRIQELGNQISQAFENEILKDCHSSDKPMFYVNLYGDDETMKRALTTTIKSAVQVIDEFLLVIDKNTNKVMLFVSLERIK